MLKVLAVIAALLLGLWLFSRAAVLVIEARWPPVGAVLRIDGLDIRVLDVPGRPAAPPLLLIHGASGNLREPVEALRDALGGRYRLIAIDRPGHGYSDRGPLGMSDPARQADVVAAVLAQLHVGPALVLGHSWGAAVAAALAVGHPGSVAGLIFVAPATHPWPGGISIRTRIFAVPYLGRAIAELFVMPAALILAPAAIRAVFDPDSVPPDYASRIGALLAVRPATFIANARDVTDLYANVVRLSPRYSEIRVPTEIVTGDADPIVEPSIHSYGLARDIPGARLSVIPGAGHMLHWSHPQEVVAAIDRVAVAVRERSLAAQ